MENEIFHPFLFLTGSLRNNSDLLILLQWTIKIFISFSYSIVRCSNCIVCFLALLHLCSFFIHCTLSTYWLTDWLTTFGQIGLLSKAKQSKVSNFILFYGQSQKSTDFTETKQPVNMAFLRFAILLLTISHNKANHMGEYNGCLRSKLFEE